MSDLRYRDFRMKVYARLCPSNLAPAEREEFLSLLDELNEDGMERFFQRQPTDPKLVQVLRILGEARGFGERLSVLDRTVPALPHGEIAECYRRLRALGDQVGDLEALGELK
jgi:hypothetical protein